MIVRVFESSRVQIRLSVKRRLVSSIFSSACLLSPDTLTLRSEFFSSLCSRSLLGAHSDARRMSGCGAGGAIPSSAL